jgi:hypothetical protein
MSQNSNPGSVRNEWRELALASLLLGLLFVSLI